MAYAIDGDIALETRQMYLRCETESELTRGMVVMDVLGFTGGEANATVVIRADHERFMARFEATLNS